VADTLSSLNALAALPGMPEHTAAAREACTQLRWHEALRRRIPEAAAESRVRGARASAALEGATLPVELVRDLMRGARSWPERLDPVEQVAKGVVQATAETEHVQGLLRTAPLQALARLHVAAAAGLVDDDALGRPRQPGEECRELVDLGPAPDAAALPPRLSALVDVLLAGDGAPALVVAAVVHAEVAHLRPFVRGNGAVARALERAVLQATGLDPTGVVVPEVGHGRGGGPAYVGALAAYGTGTREGVALWLEHCAQAVVAGADEGRAICDAVRAGRIG
jgi:Fic family protein